MNFLGHTKSSSDCNNINPTDILRVCEIMDSIWVMLFQSPEVYIGIIMQDLSLWF